MSWWVNVSRDDFARKCAEELPRMQTSRFGKFAGNMHDPGPPMHWWRPNRSQRMEDE